MQPQIKNLLIWLAVVVGIIFLFNMFNSGSDYNNAKITYSAFLAEVKNSNVSDVRIIGSNIEGHYKTGGKFLTYSPNDPKLIEVLNLHNVTINAEPADDGLPVIVAILIQWFPMLLFVGIWIFFMRQMQGGSKGMGFGRSKAKLLSQKEGKVTFDDVAGVEEAKEELVEIVEFLQNPRKFQELGGKIPRGALLVGSPGAGKTLIARAVAGEAGCTILYNFRF